MPSTRLEQLEPQGGCPGALDQRHERREIDPHLLSEQSVTGIRSAIVGKAQHAIGRIRLTPGIPRDERETVDLTTTAEPQGQTRWDRLASAMPASRLLPSMQLGATQARR